MTCFHDFLLARGSIKVQRSPLPATGYATLGLFTVKIFYFKYLSFICQSLITVGLRKTSKTVYQKVKFSFFQFNNFLLFLMVHVGRHYRQEKRHKADPPGSVQPPAHYSQSRICPHSRSRICSHSQSGIQSRSQPIIALNHKHRKYNQTVLLLFTPFKDI